MLDGLLGRNFSSKCKASIKVIRTRIDVIRRKRNATQKFLKKDIADLLANGLDINAYGRAEGLVAELTISSCYDFIGQSCECVLKHLSVMQKQSECPEECRTAVASLMFAAARFSDLPELRDLRHIFQEKYDNSLEYFVNQKFVENLASTPSTMEKKIQLMQGIAAEFSIRWDSRAFERTMSKPPVAAQDQPKQYRPFHVTDDRYKSPNGSNSVLKVDKIYASPKERHEVNSNGHRSHGKEDSVSIRDEVNHHYFGKHDVSGNGHRLLNGREENILKRDSHGTLFQVRQEVFTGKHETLTVTEDTTPKILGLGSSSRGKRLEPIDGGHKLYNGRGDVVPQKDGHGTLSPVNHAGRDIITDKLKIPTVKEDTMPKTHILESASRGKRLDPVDGGYKVHNGRGDAVPKKESHDTFSLWKQEISFQNEGQLVKDDVRDIPFAGRNNHAGEHKIANSIRKVQAQETDWLKLHNNAIPPPYVKPPRASKRGTSLGSNDAGFEFNGPNGAFIDPSSPNRSIAGEKSERIQLGSAYHSDHEKQVVGPVRVNSHSRDNEHNYHDGINADPLPKPRSVRRRHSKSSSSSSHADIGNPEDRKVVKRVSSGRRRGDPRQGLQIVIGDDHYQRDDEERMMDKLLLHYSKKSSTYDPEKLRRKSKAHPSYLRAADGSELPHNGSMDEQDERSDMVPHPPRSVSLPREQTGPSGATKVFARAASFQPDRLTPAQHVHPKLPDYDDLAARFAALKGR